MDTLMRDIRHAVRSLRRTPGYTIAVLLILALGVGMSTSMFTVFKAVLVDRLPIAAQEQVVIMHTLDRSGRNLDVPGTYLAEIARDSALVRGVAGVYHLVRPQPLMDGSAVVVVNVAATSANYFDVLDVRPVLGRLLRPEDGQPGAPPVLVLSYAAWRRDFGGDPSVVGRSLAVPSTQGQVRIVGVAPAGFAYPGGADVWSGDSAGIQGSAGRHRGATGAARDNRRCARRAVRAYGTPESVRRRTYRRRRASISRVWLRSPSPTRCSGHHGLPSSR